MKLQRNGFDSIFFRQDLQDWQDFFAFGEETETYRPQAVLSR